MSVGTASPGRSRHAKLLRRLPRFAVRALLSADRPLGVHLIVTRRCNLSCAYCNEYDHESDPVPFEDLADRIVNLRRLGAGIVTCSGGEPLLHPRIDDVVRLLRKNGMAASLITNGYPLTRTQIQKLNDAGLQALQISIDNLEPDDVSSKSLSALEPALRRLADHASFVVNINTVVGAATRPEDTVAIARRARDFGFAHSVGLIHDDLGALKPLDQAARSAYREVTSQALPHRANYWLFQRDLINGRPSRWKCRAGARFLYVDEDGRVHWCSQRRDTAGTPLADYGIDEIRRAFRTRKNCAPYCTLNCVHTASAFDGWRRQDLPDPGSIVATAPGSSASGEGARRRALPVAEGTRNRRAQGP